jgi:hypothetical protein
LNDAAGFYRFIDATRHTQFKAEWVCETDRITASRQFDYLRRFDLAKRRIEAFIELADAKFDLRMEPLRQNRGRFAGAPARSLRRVNR